MPNCPLIQQEHTATALSDAAYMGIGGWSPNFKFMWCVTWDNLISASFLMPEIDAEDKAIHLTNPDDLHINTLEFFAIIINIWFVILYIHQDPTKVGGHIIWILANNTSTLSWFKYAAHSHQQAICNLAYLCHHLIVFLQTVEFATFKGQHIQGKENIKVDALSCPELFPTLASTIMQHSQLQTCHAFLLPFRLLSMITRALSYPTIEASFINKIIALLTLMPTSSAIGANSMPNQMGFYKCSWKRRH